VSIRAWSEWPKAIVRISNDSGERGTGVLYAVTDPPGSTTRAFVITAAHVISKPRASIDDTLSFRLGHALDQDNTDSTTDVEVPMRSPDGERLYRLHPTADLIAIEISEPWTAKANMNLAFATSDDLITPAAYEWNELAPGDLVMVMGFPAGIHVTSSLYPIVSQGQLGSPIFEQVTLPVGKVENPVDFSGYLIDASIMKGSSGSAVILKPTANRVMRTGILRNVSQAFLLGIVSEELTRTGLLGAPQSTDVTGLALVLPPSIVRETIAQFVTDERP
jgi:hypothetical protein